MKQLRTDTGQHPHVGSFATGSVGNWTVHAKHWRRAGEMRECVVQGCPVRFTTLDVCSSCGVATEPLQAD